MALKQEMTGLEMKRINEDSHQMNTILKPLASLNKNTHDELQAELPSFFISESRSSPHSINRQKEDGLVKTSITWRPVGNNLNKEPNVLRCSGTTGACQQRRKPFTPTNLYKKVTYGEKENVVTGCSDWAGGSVEFPNQCTTNVGLSGSVDGKRLQESPYMYGNLVRGLKIKDVTKAVDGPGLSFGDGKPMHRYKACPVTAMSGPTHATSRKRQSDFRAEDFMCFPSDRSIQTSVIEPRKGATVLVQKDMKEISNHLCPESTLSMKSPLLSQYHQWGWKSSSLTQNPQSADSSLLSQLKSRLKSTQTSEESRLCSTSGKTPLRQFKAQNTGECFSRSESLTIPVFVESDIGSLQDAQRCEKGSTQNSEHFVVLFTEPKTVKGSFGRKIRQELLKFSSFCSRCSHKILSWSACLARGENIRGRSQCLRQIFSNSPRGFVNLKSHRFPDFPANVPSRSSSSKLAKDKELKAVLTKINKVLASMERTSPDSVESNPQVKSQERV